MAALLGWFLWQKAIAEVRSLLIGVLEDHRIGGLEAWR
jgi:hypothetical protein